MAKDMGYTNIVTFVDDGVSGVTMDRPGFNEMMRQLEEGKASALFVKDLSRLGRNYIEVGRLMEEFFPEHDIRLVAVSDNIDTAEGENELAPIRNLFNEWYARDISKKRLISNKIKGNAGEPMGPPPFGYMKDRENPKHWIIDEEAAQVVRRIFSMILDGYGTEQIASIFESEGILTPRAYWLKKGIRKPGRAKQQPSTKWNASTIVNILTLQEYCGDVLNFKTYSKSYKNKKRIPNDRENWAIFKDVHESVIDRVIWEQVQEKRGKIRRRKPKDGERNMFCGLLVCADCGHNLNYHFNQGNHDIKYFNCSNYNSGRGSCTSTHYIRVDFLEQVVLGEIRRLTKYAVHYEDEFQQAITAFDVAAVAFDELTDVFLHFVCIRDADAELLRHKGVVAHGETIAEVAHMPAAVVRPLIDEEFRSRKITPAPRKEMPLTTCVAIRPGSELRPAIPKSTRSTKQYFDRIMITADVTAMMQCVRIPASFWRLERSSPMRKPNSSTTRIRMRNSRLSPTVSTASGR